MSHIRNPHFKNISWFFRTCLVLERQDTFARNFDFPIEQNLRLRALLFVMPRLVALRELQLPTCCQCFVSCCFSCA